MGSTGNIPEQLIAVGGSVSRIGSFREGVGLAVENLEQNVAACGTSIGSR